MFFDSVRLHNFRLFEDTTINFTDRMSVIVGINGSGKTSLLDALGIMLSCYLGGFDGMAANRISQKDIRHITYKTGSTFENVAQPPAEISASGTIAGNNVSWKDAKTKDNQYRSSAKPFEEMTKLANGHQDQLREGDSSLLLPLIAYYGTGRLWKQEAAAKKTKSRESASFGRLDAYDGCLDAHLTDTLLSSWFERMTYKSLQQQKEPPEFTAVKQAVEGSLKALTGLEDLSIQINLDTHELDVLYTTASCPQRMPTSQLSDGYRVALNLFADIAYRAAVLNPQLGDAVLTEAEGVVLIDELDLHLHPQWQRLVLSDLVTTFPKLQFVVTTHAPAVISSVRDGSLIIMDGTRAYSASEGFYGKDANTILREIMGTPERPQEVKDLFAEFHRLVDRGNYEEAESVLQRISSLVGESDPELASCQVQLSLERMEL